VLLWYYRMTNGLRDQTSIVSSSQVLFNIGECAANDGRCVLHQGLAAQSSAGLGCEQCEGPKNSILLLL